MIKHCRIHREASFKEEEFLDLELTDRMIQYGEDWALKFVGTWDRIDQLDEFCVDRNIALVAKYFELQQVGGLGFGYSGAVLEFKSRDDALLFKLSWP